MKEQLSELRELVVDLKEIQEKCDHVWDTPKRDFYNREAWKRRWLKLTETEKPRSVAVLREKFRPLQRDRFRPTPCWSRVCKLCGKKEYTITYKYRKKKVKSPIFKNKKQV